MIIADRGQVNKEKNSDFDFNVVWRSKRRIRRRGNGIGRTGPDEIDIKTKEKFDEFACRQKGRKRDGKQGREDGGINKVSGGYIYSRISICQI